MGVEMGNATFIYDVNKPKEEEETWNEEKMEQEEEAKPCISMENTDKEMAEEGLSLSVEEIAEEGLSLSDEETAEEDASPSDTLALQDIDFSCGRGEFIAIVGSVGSGKSSFVSSMLGGLKVSSGSLAVKGRIAYFPQIPFILNDTVQQNSKSTAFALVVVLISSLLCWSLDSTCCPPHT